MDAAAIIAIISVSTTGMATLITTVFSSMSLSRCSKIACCWDCFTCDRNVLDNNTFLEAERDLNNNE